MKFFSKKINKNTKGKRGFTLLFAVLVATLVVSIGATIISIALRQTILSGTTRESQYAFYAANTVLECAHYWDTTTNIDLGGKVIFPSPGETGIAISDEAAAQVTCAGVNIITGTGNEIDNGPERPIEDIDDGVRTFYLKIKDKEGISRLPSYEYCAQATVTKISSGDTIITTIEAKGYNTCIQSNPRRVERGLVQQYES